MKMFVRNNAAIDESQLLNFNRYFMTMESKITIGERINSKNSAKG